MATTFGAKSSPKHVPAIIAAVVTIAFLILGFKRLDLTGTDFLTRVEFLWMDYKFKIRGPQTSGNEVLLVGLDGKTLNRYGSGRLFQRDIFANLVDRLPRAKPKIIGFDITFPDPDPTNPDNDKKFAQSIKRAGNVVLGIELVLESNVGDRRAATPIDRKFEDIIVAKQIFPAERRSAGESGKLSSLIRASSSLLNLPELTDAALSFGFVNFHRDVEGGLRYQPQFIEYRSEERRVGKECRSRW